MTFLEAIFGRLQAQPCAAVICEIHGEAIVSVTGTELLVMIQQARNFLAAKHLKKGDRCALFAPNGIRWVALDLAMMAEGLIVVPLYARQALPEIIRMMEDSAPALICCADAASAAEIAKLWPSAPEISSFDSIFTSSKDVTPAPPFSHTSSDALTIIYTSGTSGEPKGVVLNAANITHMLTCTNGRLDELMGNGKDGNRKPDRIFHYGPFCFAASWILLLTALARDSVLMLSTDISKLSDELSVAAPNYFLNVPIVLERVRAKIEEAIRKRGGFVAGVYTRAQQAYLRRHRKERVFADFFWLWFANATMFPTIRKSIGANLKALICGSAPLSVETQLFFMMIGIPVLQAYGLTETTAICTLDSPHSVVPGRVGRAVPGVEMTVSDIGEILVRGPNIFPGYWQRPAETAKALEGGWFHTGDQGEVDASGNWRITGRLKDLIILNSGHNVAPEPLEQRLAANLSEAQQVVLIGNQRSFLAALVTTASSNGVHSDRVQSAIDAMNAGLPHYKQIRAFHVVPKPFSIEDGLLTAMGKLKRDAIAMRYSAEIEQLYQKKNA